VSDISNDKFTSRFQLPSNLNRRNQQKDESSYDEQYSGIKYTKSKAKNNKKQSIGTMQKSAVKYNQQNCMPIN